MDIQTLQREIVAKSLKPIYVFTGIEHGIMRIYIDKMAEALSTSAILIDTTIDVYNQCVRPKMLASQQINLYVVRDDKKYLDDPKLWATMEATATATNNVVIFVYSKLDKRTKLWKEGKVIEFLPLSSEMLSKYIQKEVELDAGHAAALAKICDYDYSRCLMEIDKIKHYSKGAVLPVNKALDELLSKHAIYEPIGDITFKLTDAILTRDLQLTEYYLKLAKLKSEPEILLLSVLYNGFRQILLVQGCGSDSSNLTQKTGLTGYQVKLALDKRDYYTIPELIEAVKITRELELGIKRGTIDASIAIDTLLIHVLPYKNVSAN